jgi:hypothetical protein
MNGKLKSVCLWSSSATFALWIFLIANQSNPALILVLFHLAMASAIVALRAYGRGSRKSPKVTLLLAIGAAAGYAAAAMAAVATECVLRGAVCLDRGMSQNLLGFPLLSLSPVYGAGLCLLILGRRSSRSGPSTSPD